VYPHPTNPDRYVAELAPTSSTGMFLTDNLPRDMDFVIVDGRIPDRDNGRPDSEVHIAGGMFDNGWRVNPAFVENGDPAVRARCPLRTAPTWLTSAVHSNSIQLSQVIESAAEGPFASMVRDQNWQGKPITLGDVTYPTGIGVQSSQDPCSATYDLTGAGWGHLRATIGIEVDVPSLGQQEMDNTLVQFVVEGDGQELYKSPVFHWNSDPINIDVDIHDVKSLKLRVLRGATWHNAALSVDWANIRLER